MNDVIEHSPKAMAALPLFSVYLFDESLYGMLCRYHCTSGNAEDSETRKQISGNLDYLPDKFLGRDLLIRVSHSTGLSLDYLINHHTQIPVCLWLDHGFHDGFQDYLSNCDIENEFFPQSIVPKRRRANYNRDIPKFCMTCYKNDIETYGFPYWHLFHQPQFVTVCAKHNSRLLYGCPQCGNPFPCNAYELPAPQCRRCTDLVVTAAYLKHFRVSECEWTIAKIVKCITDVHERPRRGWRPIIGTRRTLAHLGMNVTELSGELSDFGVYLRLVAEDLERAVNSLGVWSCYLNESRHFNEAFCGFRALRVCKISYIEAWMKYNSYYDGISAIFTLWLLAFAVAAGMSPQEAVSIYMGDDIT